MEKTRRSWNNRAKKLNCRLLPDKFNWIPDIYNGQDECFQEMALSSITDEWVAVV